MEIDEIRDYCLTKPGATESFPFGDSALVFKTAEGKMFALLMIDSLPISMNLKCDPQRALELRETYDYVQPGYHMNKKHWNTIIVHPSTDPDLITAWIDHSFDLVCKKKRT